MKLKDRMNAKLLSTSKGVSKWGKQAWRRKLTNTKAMAYPNSAPNSSLQILDAHSPYLTHLISRSRSMWRPAIVRGGKPLWGSCGVALRGLPSKGLGFKVCCCINSFMAATMYALISARKTTLKCYEARNNVPDFARDGCHQCALWHLVLRSWLH